MANVTIPNLTSATTIAPSTDLMVLEQTNGTRKATLSQIFTSSATSGSGLGITSGGVYTIKAGLDSNISDINTLLGNTSIAGIGDGTVTGAISTLNSDLSNKQNKTDNSLSTSSKTIVGAINEVKTSMLKMNVVNLTVTFPAQTTRSVQVTPATLGLSGKTLTSISVSVSMTDPPLHNNYFVSVSPYTNSNGVYLNLYNATGSQANVDLQLTVLYTES